MCMYDDAASMAPTQEAKACAAPEDGTHVTRTRSGSESHHYEDEITINVPSQTAQEGQVLMTPHCASEL